MERSRKVLLKISSVSQQVVTAASKYADWRGSHCIPRVHFQLEKDMRRISVACNTFADILGKSSSTDDPEFDIRLQDWFCTEEPQICLDTLIGMIKLLQTGASFWTMFNPWGGQPAQDRIEEAVELLHSFKDCFHFLFSTTSLDNESTTQNIPQSQSQINTEQTDTQLQIPLAVQSNTDASIPDLPLQTGTAREIPADKQRGKRNGKTLDDISKWLDGLNCTEKQDRTLLLRQPDTCEWLFDTTQYKTWWNSETSSLWLRGKPGAGKSVLAWVEDIAQSVGTELTSSSSVIESLEKFQRKGGILAFFYCDFRNERSTNASEVLRSLLSQLLRQLPDNASDLGSLLDDLVYAKDRGGATRENVKELAGFVSRAAGLFAQRPLIVVDALDECKNIEDLLKSLIALQGHGRLFVTSRPLQVIKSRLTGFSSISMDDMVEELSADIALHVTRELATRRRLRDLDVDTKTEIHAVLCCRADGMFRWVECSIDTLNRCATMKEVHEALTNLPEGLDETYERVLRAIDIKTRDGQLALRALVWLVAALRPLKIQELMEGLSIDLEDRVMDFSIGPMHKVALLDACGSLVAYSEETEIIILSHFSVKEYLIGEVSYAQLPKHHINWERAHLQLVRSCMCYISICLSRLREASNSGGTLVDTSRGSNEHNKHLGYVIPIPQPLRDYVMSDALSHFQHLGSQFSLVLHDIEAFANVIEQHWCMWDNICLSTITEVGWGSAAVRWPVSKHDLPIYILVALAPASILHSYLSLSAPKPKKDTNPLIYAAYFNREQHTRVLLSRGANLSCKGWVMDVEHLVLPIEVAMSCGHTSIVALYLAEESPVPTSVFRQLSQDIYDYIPTSIYTMLLNTDDFVEAVNDVNVLDIVQLFRAYLRVGFSEQDLVAIMRRLIQVGTGSLNTGNHPFRPGLLLDSATEFCGEDNALAVATFSVKYYYPGELSEETVRVALRLCYPIIIKYLLSLGLSLPLDSLCVVLCSNAVRRSYPSAHRRLMSTIHLLIENGADMHACAEDQRGDSVLHAILRPLLEDDGPMLDMTKRLIGYGCDPRKANLVGETPFYVALSSGHLAVARYLHSLGVPLPDHSISVVLKSPSAQNRNVAPIVHFLIENGADVKTSSTGTEGPVLHSVLASSECSKDADMLEITKLLINGGCDPFEVNSSGQSALHIAIKFGHPSVIRYLLSLGIPLPLDSLLIASEARFHSALADLTSLYCLLIENGADLHAHTAQGDSALHLVLREFINYGDEALNVTTLLVTSGCDPLEVDSFGRTPIRIAVEYGHLSSAEYLHSMGILLPRDSVCAALSKLQRSENAAHRIRFLVSNGADINTCTAKGDSPYHTLFATGLPLLKILEITKMLVNNGCNPLQVNSYGQSPLDIAIQGGLEVGRGRGYRRWGDKRPGWGPVVGYLLSLGIPLPQDSLLTASRSSNHYNQAKGQPSILRLLLDNGADIHACTKEGRTALHLTLLADCEDCNEDEALEAAKVLVAGGCDPFRDPASMAAVFKAAVERARTSTARYLVNFGVPLPPGALFIALSSPQPRFQRLRSKAPMIHFLIDTGADAQACTISGDSALHLAFQSELDEEDALGIARYLVAGGCDPLQLDSQGKSVIQIAIEHGYVSVTKYLVSQVGVPLPSRSLLNVLDDQRRVLWGWKRRCHPPNASLFRFLVESGDDVHGSTPDGDSLFHVVLRSYYTEDDALEITKLLVNRNCDFLQRNSFGSMPLYIALERRNFAVAEYLWSIDPCNTDWDDSRNKSRSGFQTKKATLRRRCSA